MTRHLAMSWDTETVQTIRNNRTSGGVILEEELNLTGTGAINGTGNELDNELIGNSNANILTGGSGNDILDGGIGVDTLSGGLGNDTYKVDVVSDVIMENVNEGTDIVQSSVSYTLDGNIENLTSSRRYVHKRYGEYP